MNGLASPPGADVVRPVIWKLRSFGLEGEAEVEAVIEAIRARVRVSEGEVLIEADASPTYLTVLLDGIACSYETLPDGGRQIHAFQYPGDFCDLQREALQESNGELAVSAVTDCLIGTVRYQDLDRI